MSGPSASPQEEHSRSGGSADGGRLLEFFRAVGRLKALPRQGWVDRGVQTPESVADHTYRSTIMAWVLGELAGLEAPRLMKLMLLHDLPEVEVGDATPYGPVVARGAELADAVQRWRELLTADELSAARMERERRELNALTGLTSGVPAPLRAELLELRADYGERRSPEARFAAQVDKLEALLQAIEYREAGHEADVESFLVSAREAVEHPMLVTFLAQLAAVATSSEASPEAGPPGVSESTQAPRQ